MKGEALSQEPYKQQAQQNYTDKNGISHKVLYTKQGTVFGRAISDYFKDNGSTENTKNVPLYYRKEKTNLFFKMDTVQKPNNAQISFYNNGNGSLGGDIGANSWKAGLFLFL